MGRKSGIPQPTLHKPSGRARVRIAGKDHYLGPWGSEEAERNYRSILQGWLKSKEDAAESRSPLAAEPTPPGGLVLVSELAVRYLDYCDQYYRSPDGTPTGEARNVRDSIKELVIGFGGTPAQEFTPRRLKEVRQQMIDRGLSRGEINKRIGRVVRLFKWSVSEELLPPSIHQALATVEGLKRGRTEARESEKVRALEDREIDPLEPFCSPTLWVMIQIQRLTGMRPGEITGMRPAELDRSRSIWVYAPARHKTQHHGKGRAVAIGPRAQALLLPFLEGREPDEFVFSPKVERARRFAARRASRKSKVQPSQVDRSKPGERRPGLRYSVRSYFHAVRRIIDAYNAKHPNDLIFQWSPNQLRHTAATRIRREFGLDAARAALGHSSLVVTEIYAERDLDAAQRVAEKIG